jgi:beta-lactam-binding protein with PASTA domain/predicted Ser/Thr protein kinase
MSESGKATVISDRYEIHKRVGRGGMADVFLAKDLLLDRQVAIKILFPEFAVDPNFVERFRREAQAAANLSHPNIVNVYDWGKYEGTYFIAMEYVQGRTLAEILKTNKQLTPKQAAEIASEVAAALGFAHEAGLAHRDIKPANILIGANGQVKVADFGIARAMNAGTESNLTQAGSVMGTASYFSPEQAQGAQPDPRSDLYSLGIVMYEMVAGRPPFTGENPVSIAYKQVHDRPTPLNQLVENMPRPFEAIVAKLLAKDPKLRYPSAHALRDDLRRFRNGEQVQALVAAAARPGTPSGGMARPAAAAAAAAAAYGATSVVGTTPIGADPNATRTAHAHPQIHGAPTGALPSQPSADITTLPPGASPEARYYQDSNSRTGWYALAAFIALVALVAGGVLLYQGLTKDADEVSAALTLDDYTGQPLDSVTQALTSLGLQYRVFAEENAQFPENFVHRTVPEPGTVVPEGQLIELYYNPTASLVTIPNVAGRTLEEAATILGNEGFEIVESSELSDVAEGLVIRTDPAAESRVPQDTIITVVVSGGPDQVAVPPIVIGDSEEDARALLESDQYGLLVTSTSQVDDVIPAGVVISTNPPPNTLVDRGSTVELIVSSGPGQVRVPPLVGLTEGQARNLLGDAGLGIEPQYRVLDPGDPADGTVLEQSIPPNQEVDKGTVISVVIGQARVAETTTTTSTTTTTTTTTTLPPTTTAATTTVAPTTP